MIMDEAQQTETQQKCEEYLAGWKRALADYDNLKKELAREKEEMRERVKERVAEQLIPILDHFDQANRHVPVLSLGEEEATKFQNWLNGLRHVQTQLEGVMRELGLEMIATDGVADPYLHEIVSEQIDEQRTPGVILEVVQTGWKLNARVVRPAKVIINDSNLLDRN